MRKFLLAGSALVALAAVPSAASAQVAASDVVVAPGAAVVVSPPAMIDRQVYMTPGTTGYIAPGTAFPDQPIYFNGQPYYRDCWWDWGQRRCELRPWPR